MHIYLKLFYSFINFSKFPYMCFGLISDHLQGAKNYTYNTSICSFNCICSVDHLCLIMYFVISLLKTRVKID
jgi:hypothetical protein